MRPAIKYLGTTVATLATALGGMSLVSQLGPREWLGGMNYRWDIIYRATTWGEKVTPWWPDSLSWLELPWGLLALLGWVALGAAWIGRSDNARSGFGRFLAWAFGFFLVYSTLAGLNSVKEAEKLLANTPVVADGGAIKNPAHDAAMNGDAPNGVDMAISRLIAAYGIPALFDARIEGSTLSIGQPNGGRFDRREGTDLASLLMAPGQIGPKMNAEWSAPTTEFDDSTKAPLNGQLFFKTRWDYGRIKPAYLQLGGEPTIEGWWFDRMNDYRRALPSKQEMPVWIVVNGKRSRLMIPDTVVMNLDVRVMRLSLKAGPGAADVAYAAVCRALGNTQIAHKDSTVIDSLGGMQSSTQAACDNALAEVEKICGDAAADVRALLTDLQQGAQKRSSQVFSHPGGVSATAYWAMGDQPWVESVTEQVALQVAEFLLRPENRSWRMVPWAGSYEGQGYTEEQVQSFMRDWSAHHAYWDNVMKLAWQLDGTKSPNSGGDYCVRWFLAKMHEASVAVLNNPASAWTEPAAKADRIVRWMAADEAKKVAAAKR